MEIKNTLMRGVDPYRTQQLDKGATAAQKSRTSTEQAAAAPSGDRVSLSASARLHTAARGEVMNAPEVRQEKVSALKEQVSSGEYTVDARKTAEKLLQSEAFLANTLAADNA